MDTENIVPLLAGYFRNELDQPTQEEVEAWIDSAPENREMALQVCRLTQYVLQDSMEERQDTEALLRRVDAVVKNKKSPVYRWVLKSLGLAAVAALGFFFGSRFFSHSIPMPIKSTGGLTLAFISAGMSVRTIKVGSPKSNHECCVALKESELPKSRIPMAPFSETPAKVWLNWSAWLHPVKILTISSWPYIGGAQGCEIHENMPPMAPVGTPVELSVARNHASAKQSELWLNLPFKQATDHTIGNMLSFVKALTWLLL